MHQKTMQDNSKEIKTRRKETNHVKTHQKLSVSRHKLYLLCCNTPWLIKKTKLSLAPIQEAHFTMVWYKFWRKLLFSILIIALVILKYCCTDCTEFEGIFRENAAVSKYLGMISTDNYKHLINQCFWVTKTSEYTLAYVEACAEVPWAFFISQFCHFLTFVNL